MRSLALIIVVLAGCPSPNTYTTARTLAPGRFQVQAAPEVFGALGKNTNDKTIVDAHPTLPTVGARIGIVDQLEIGARLPNLASVAGDAKVNFVRGTVDVAFDLGVQWYNWSATSSSSDGTRLDSYSGNVFYIEAPLLVDFNVSRDVTVIASPGVTLIASTGTSSSFLGQLGLGLDLRATRWLAITPQITFLSGFSSSTDVIFMGGLGLSFGRQPSFDDLGAHPTEPGPSDRMARR